MIIIQLLIIIVILLYALFSSINFMEPPGEASDNWKASRNWRLGILLILVILLYLAGTFNKIL
jgi:cytochrome c-type biogenesis protein CcmE